MHERLCGARMIGFSRGATMKGSAKRVLENFKALEPEQQERVKQALEETLKISLLARAQVIQNRSKQNRETHQSR